jgi:GNAT superfamily N-acetyltransferase
LVGSGDAEVRLRAGEYADARASAEVQLESALAGFAHIFPESVAKPTQRDLEAQWTQLLADPNKSVVVAEAEGRVVGVVSFGTDSDLAPAGYGQLGKLYVRPSHAGLGIGSSLHDVAITELRAAGHSAAWLWVLEGNLRARRMYERRGWVGHTNQRRTDWPGSGVFEMAYSRVLR